MHDNHDIQARLTAALAGRYALGRELGRAGAAAARVPALVVVGTDTLLPRSRALAGWWPGARLVEVAGADHVDVLARPQLLAALRAALRGRGLGRAP